MTFPKISVVIPAYNAEKHIAETINSLLEQTLTNFEIIVINDGSKDNTLTILETYHENRLRLYTQENAGVSAARNKAISLAKAPYIYFLDADDILMNNTLERCLNAIENNCDAVAVYGEVLIFETLNELKNNTIRTKPIFTKRPSGNILEDILTHNCIACGSAIMVKKSALLQTSLFSPSIHLGEDWALWVELAIVGDFIYLPPPNIVFYRQHSSSAARTLAVNAERMLPAINYIFNLEKVQQSFSVKRLEKLENKARSASYCYAAQENLKNKAYSKSKEQFLKALTYQPFNLRTWILLTCATLKKVPLFIRKKLK